MSKHFVSQNPSVEDYWRGIILFGRNVASYKFALAQTLLELNPSSGQLLKLGDLAPVFSGQLTDHLKLSDKQGTSNSSKYLDGCRRFNNGNLTQNELINLTIQHGFTNVIDAFHIVGQGEIEKRFYTDERKQNKGIRITDEFSELLGRDQAVNLSIEADARWRLVETAWELNLPRTMIAIGYDSNEELLFTIDHKSRRKPVTGSRGALNGYQKGKCFYCFSDIKIEGSDLFAPPEVDHFFPHMLKNIGFGAILDGVWNLVLSCQDCNRGVGGKFEQIPTLRLLERLHSRNEYLIGSHHPLRETLLKQTGQSAAHRIKFLNDFYNRARSSSAVPLWDSQEKCEPFF
jgi:hypothetical protein